jgi:hypothetical protein
MRTRRVEPGDGVDDGGPHGGLPVWPEPSMIFRSASGQA